MTVSLPREMLRKLEATRELEHRSRSALVREALQLYFTISRAAAGYTPTLPKFTLLSAHAARLRAASSSPWMNSISPWRLIIRTLGREKSRARATSRG
jgi:hypothetical protein